MKVTVQSEGLPHKMVNNERSSAAGDRLVVIDYLKGIAVIWFTIGHNIIYWEDQTWRSLASIIALSLDWTGPGLFIAFTVFGTLISIRRRMITGNTRGMFKNALIKSSFLLIVGEILNLMINAMSGNVYGIWHIFGANMITDVALAQLLTFGLVKLSIKARSLLLMVLCILYPILLFACLNGISYNPASGYIPIALNNPAYIMYFLLFDMEAMSPTMSWLITAVLASILFEGFTKQYINTDGKKLDIKTQKNQSRRFILFGVGIITIAIAAGGLVLFRGIGMGGWLYDWLVTNDPFRFYTLSGLPLIIMRHVPQYLFFNAGILVITFGALHYIVVVKNKTLVGQKSLMRLGKYSFSIFLFTYIFGIIPIKLSLYIFVPVNVAIIAIMIILVNLWETRAHGIGSIEWFFTKYVMYVSTGLISLATKRNAKKNLITS